jgi:serine phosphatase RsbU (regulator of sigma subunit)
MRIRPSTDKADARGGARTRWLELTLVAAAITTAAVCLTHVWTAPLELVLLLAVVPALAGIGAVGVQRPLAYGGAALIAGVAIDALVKGGITVTDSTHALPLAAIGSVIVVTAISMRGSVVGARRKDTQQVQQDQQFADVTSIAEATQRAVLRQLPETVGPLTIGVVYLAAAAEARVGGDLYEVAATAEHGVRLIIGDVRGKGLGAVEVAADIIGRFRELAYSVHTLDELAYRLDAGLSRRWGPHEEFVTALLVQIDTNVGRLTILNCGHPPPILISIEDGVTVLEVPAPAPPLGLLTLGSDAGAKGAYQFRPNDQLLLYTDGVTEARDAAQAFYPLDERVAVLAPQAQPKASKSARAAARQLANGSVPSLLDLVRDDLLRHVGSPPHDDAAMLLVRAPAAWPNPVRERRPNSLISRTDPA